MSTTLIYNSSPPLGRLAYYVANLFLIPLMAKEKVINIRVEAELKKQAKKLAEEDGRSLSNWILKLVQIGRAHV